MTYDVIIVLGAAVLDGYQPSPSLHRRVLHSIKLFKERASDIILMTGGIGKFPPAEAVVMKSLAVQYGIPQENILIENKSKTTFESMKNCVEIMESRGWKTAIIVTDSFHICRSVYTLRSFGFDASGSSPTENKQNTKIWKWIYYYIREFFAFPYYICLVSLNKLKIRYQRNQISDG